MGESALLNHYPCTVVTPLGEKRRVRVLVTADRAEVWELVAGVPTLTESASVASFEQPRRRNLDPFVVTTTDGERWEIRKAGGCGCGSRLKSFDPLGGARRVGT